MIHWWNQLIERGGLPWLLRGVDMLLINLAFFTAWWARYEQEIGLGVEIRFYTPYSDYFPTAVALTLLILLNLYMEGVYKARRGSTWFDEVYSITNATSTAILMVVVFFFFYRPYAFSRLIFAYAAALIVVYLSLSRLLIRWWLGWLRRRGVGVTRTLIVGGGELGRTLMRHIVAQPELGYEVIGFVDDNPDRQHDIGRFRALGNTDDIPCLVRQHQVDKVIITLPWQYQRKIMEILEHCEQEAVQTRIVPDLFQLSLTHVILDEIKGVALIAMQEPALKGGNLAFKRLTDLTATTLIMLVGVPLMLLIALAIRLDSPGSILFKQTRVGRGGRLFTLYKFRSMRVGAEREVQKLVAKNEADGPLFKIRNDPRVTRVGAFIRKTSLDELPQFWNVLKGDMSLIGPRPALPSEVAQYQEWHRKRLEAAPGLTGLWQVSGRSDVTFDEMMLLDIYYTEQWSPMLDTMILLKTIPTVLFQRGAY
ncbi:MAG: undecaprenyl-phosphate glucose phosphotransferase [Ardenticatenales bacterium]|nr:undecaprenyl-phosphate glucose phosphotransferase [Ardenticatenales bacterium]